MGNAEYMGTVVDAGPQREQLNMKVMGLFVLAVACCCLLSDVSAAPLPAPLIDPLSATIGAAGGAILASSLPAHWQGAHHQRASPCKAFLARLLLGKLSQQELHFVKQKGKLARET